jgi:hypothetical protein
MPASDNLEKNSLMASESLVQSVSACIPSATMADDLTSFIPSRLQMGRFDLTVPNSSIFIGRIFTALAYPDLEITKISFTNNEWKIQGVSCARP